MADAVDRVFGLSVDRNKDGSRNLSVEVAVATVDDDMTYTALSLVRKLREYPRTQADGFEVWSSALTPVALSDTHLDDLPVAEGETSYYSLFALDADAAWKEKARVDSLTVEQRLEEISDGLFPRKLLEDSGNKAESTAVLKVATFDVAFSEIESLIRQFPIQQDIDVCGRLALVLLSMEKDWPVGPVDDLVDARELLKQIKEKMRERGTEAMEDELFETVSHCPVRVHRGLYYSARSAGRGDASVRDWRMSQVVAGVDVGGGDFQYAATLEVPPRGIRPFSVAVGVDGVTYVDDGAGNVVDPAAAVVGTVVYLTGVLDITVPDTLGVAEFEYSVMVTPVSAGASWCSTTLVRDRAFRSASKKRTVAEVILDGYLDTESYDASIVNDLATKLKKFWSAEGPTDFVMSVSAELTGDADELMGRLPIENERRS